MKHGHNVFIFAQSDPNYKDTEPFIFRYPSLSLPLGEITTALPMSPFVDQLLPMLKLNVIHTHHPILLGQTAARKAAVWDHVVQTSLSRIHRQLFPPCEKVRKLSSKALCRLAPSRLAGLAGARGPDPDRWTVVPAVGHRTGDAARGSRQRTRGRRRHGGLGEGVHGSEDRGLEELLRRTVLGCDGEERRLPEDAEHDVELVQNRVCAGPVRGQPQRVLGRKAQSRGTSCAPVRAPRPRPPADRF